MKKKIISVVFAVILTFLLVAEGVIPVQAADQPSYNIRFIVTDNTNNVHYFFVPNAAPASNTAQQLTLKLNGTGQIDPFISNATMLQYGIQQLLEFDVMRICSEVAVITNTNQASVSVSGNHVSMQTLSPNIIPGTTIDIVISGKHEPMANSITTQSSATCTTEGREIATCSKCYQQYVYRILPIDPNRHRKGIKTIDKDATCTEAGQYHYECEKCGAELSKKQTIPAKGHTWTDSGSGLVCSVCGKKSEAKASGIYCGIPWEMDADGNLTLNGGICSDTYGTKWNDKDVKTVKCDGEIVCNNYFCNRLFYQNTNLVSADLSGFNTSNVTSMFDMFYECKLTSLDLSNFNTSNVKSLWGTFHDCKNLTSLDVSNWNTSNVTNMSSMFEGCSSLTSLDVSNFNTSNVTDMSHMFLGCASLTSLDVSDFNTSNVTNMSDMFSYCRGLTSLDISNFNTSNVKYMGNMFNYCESLTSLNVSNFNTSNVTNMSSMFEGCSSLTSLNVSNFNTSNVKYMGNMFDGCSGLTSLDVSNFNTSKVTTMERMFNRCNKLASLDISSFDTSNVKTMSHMFDGCFKLTSLDFSNFDTSKVTNMNHMFNLCFSLAALDVSSFDTSNVTDMSGMFSWCNNLEVLITPKTINTTNIDLPFTMYDKNGNEYNKITVTNTKLYKDPQFKIFVNKTVRIKGIAIGSRKIRVRY